MKKLLLFSTVLLIHIGFAQDGALDLTFNPPVHFDTASNNGFSGEIQCLKILSSGRILVYGESGYYMDQPCGSLIMLNANGSVYPGFNVGTGPSQVYTGYPSPTLIDEQPDGKILVGGYFTQFNGSMAHSIIRLNPNGSVDNTFTIGNGANGVVTCIKVLDDGKIMVGGSFTTFGSSSRHCLVRLNANGTVDNTFAIGTGFDFVLSGGGTVEDPYISSIAVQGGKYLLAGKFNRFKSQACSRGIIRLNGNGTLDNTFLIGAGTPESGRVNQMIYDAATDKIYIGGFLMPIISTINKKVMRLHGDGTPDAAYNDNVPALETSFSSINSIALLDDDSLLIAGEMEIGPYRNNMKRLLPDGNDDTSFMFNSSYYDLNVLSVAPDGGIYVGGHFEYCGSNPSSSNEKRNIVKIEPDGQTDISFNPNLGTPNYGKGLFLKDNGEILINATSYNERECTVAQIDVTGKLLNPDFFQDINGDTPGFQRIHKSGAGSLLYLGYLSCYKMSEDGVLDDSFYNIRNSFPETVFDCNFDDFVELPDGKMIVAGNFKLPPLSYRQRILRLNADGTIDNTYNIGVGFESNTGNYSMYQHVNSLALQPDQKIVAAGTVDRLLGQPIGRIARLNPDGTPDATFFSGTGFDKEVYKVLLLPNDKVLACGLFTQYNGNPTKFIARLNADGSFDNTFTSPFSSTNAISRVEEMVLQEDGKIVLASFDAYTLSLQRLNADGSFDSTFDNTHVFTLDAFGNGSGYMSSLILLPDNQILLRGAFIEIDGIERQHIAMFGNAGTLSVEAPELPLSESLKIVNPVKEKLEMLAPKNFSSISIYDLNGRKIITSKGRLPDVSKLPAGVYILQVESALGIQSVKMIKL